MTDAPHTPPPAPRVFRDRLIEAADARHAARESASLADLQRETNRLLRLNLMEQQLQARDGEFRTRLVAHFPGSMLDGLLGFHRAAADSGDEVAAEWAARQLDDYRHRVETPEDQRKIDRATDRPDRVNMRTVDAHLRALRGRSDEDMEAFVGRAMDTKDANTCVAAFLVARETPDGPARRWVRKVLSGLAEFPDAAIAALTRMEDVERDRDVAEKGEATP